VKATSISGDHMTLEDKRVALRKCEDYKLFYITPKMLFANKGVMLTLDKLHKNKVLDRIVIDECHCISYWGHTIMKEFMRFNVLKLRFPDVPLLCLTATATTKVKKEVLSLLRIEDSCLVFQNSFNRPNLFFEVRSKGAGIDDDIGNLLLEPRFNGKSGIIYC
jgi:bloom syndrome protein